MKKIFTIFMFMLLLVSCIASAVPLKPVYTQTGIGVTLGPDMILELISPISKVFNTNDNVEFKYMVSDKYKPLDQAFVCRLFIAEEGGDLKATGDSMDAVPAYIDMLSGFSNNKFIVSDLTAGDYEWNVQCINSDGARLFAEDNGKFSITGSDLTLLPVFPIFAGEDDDEEDWDDYEDVDDEDDDDEDDEDDDDDDNNTPRSIIEVGSIDYSSSRNNNYDDYSFEDQSLDEVVEQVDFKDSKSYLPFLMSSTFLALILVFLLLATMLKRN